MKVQVLFLVVISGFSMVHFAGSAWADDGAVCSVQSQCISRITDCQLGTPDNSLNSADYETNWEFIYDIQDNNTCVTETGGLVHTTSLRSTNVAEGFGTQDLNGDNEEGYAASAQASSADGLAKCKAEQAQILLQYSGACSSN